MDTDTEAVNPKWINCCFYPPSLLSGLFPRREESGWKTTVEKNAKQTEGKGQQQKI
jgi:hypothetical protein